MDLPSASSSPQPPVSPGREDRRAGRLASSALALAQVASRLDVPVWQAGQLARSVGATAPTGWPALDAELPGRGWPPSGLTELLIPAGGGELALLAPWLGALVQRHLGPRELVWVAPPARPSATALQALGLESSRLVLVEPGSMADAAWAAEQALRAGSCAAVLWWSEGLDAGAPPVALPIWRRLHLAAQAGATPFFALRPTAARSLGSPAPLRLRCTPLEGRQLAVEVFKRRGPPMAAPLRIALPWPASVRRGARTSMPGRMPGEPATLPGSPHDAVARPAPAAPAASGAVPSVVGA